MDGGSPLWGSHLFHERGRNKNVFNFISFHILFRGKCQICWTNLICTKFELCLFFFCCKLHWIKKLKATLTLKVMDLFCKVFPSPFVFVVVCHSMISGVFYNWFHVYLLDSHIDNLRCLCKLYFNFARICTFYKLRWWLAWQQLFICLAKICNTFLAKT